MARKPEQLLADDMRNGKNWIEQLTGERTRDHPDFPAEDFDLIVLDDDAITMAIDLSHAPIKDLLRMLDVARLPSEWTWIEWRSQPYLDAGRRHAIAQGKDPARWTHARADARMGILMARDDDRIHIRCVEHAEHMPQVFMWPLAYELSTTGQPIEPRVTKRSERIELKKGQLDRAAQVSIVWGYGVESKDLLKLDGLALSVIPAEYQHIRQHGAIFNGVAQQLQGFVRHVVAILALLTTSTQTTASERPQGRYIGPGAKSSPYTKRRYASLYVPRRIRDATGYVMRQIKEESDRCRHRRHKVIGHFRHLSERPVNGDGWTPCYCQGREPGKYWHKHIDSHWRGDESLGTVEHDYVLVKGKLPEAVNG